MLNIAIAVITEQVMRCQKFNINDSVVFLIIYIHVPNNYLKKLQNSNFLLVHPIIDINYIIIITPYDELLFM